jgi:hypothetical protein
MPRWAIALLAALAAAPAAADPMDDIYGAPDPDAAARAYVEANRSPSLPDGYTLPYLACDDHECLMTQAKLTYELPLAYQGDYQSQRNVAYCLTFGCEAFRPALVLGCAWRVVIQASGSVEVDDSDTLNLRDCLGRIDTLQVATAKAQAGRLFKAIYGQPIASDWR